MFYFFFFSSRRRHTRCSRDWSSDVCSSDLIRNAIDFVAPHQQPEKTVSEAADIRPVANVIGQANKRKRQTAEPAPSRVTRKPLSGWQEYAHALLLTNEASFVN